MPHTHSQKKPQERGGQTYGLETPARLHYWNSGSRTPAAQCLSGHRKPHPSQPASGRVWLSDGERQNLAEIGQRLGRQALEEIATIVKPDTILAWHRKLMAQKFDGSPQRNAPGRPPINADLEALVVRLAQENRSWGYDRLAGALQHLGYTIIDQTVGNILKGMGFRQHRSVSTRRPGMNLSGHTWTCWWPRTFSPPRSGPGVDW
jgi:hypothetical protein